MQMAFGGRGSQDGICHKREASEEKRRLNEDNGIELGTFSHLIERVVTLAVGYDAVHHGSVEGDLVVEIL